MIYSTLKNLFKKKFFKFCKKKDIENKYLKKLEQMEQAGLQKEEIKFSQKLKIKSYFPILVFLTSLGVYYYYSKNKDKKDNYSFTLSNKSITSHKESLILSQFNYETKEQMLIYLPALFISSIFLSRNMKSLKYLSLFFYQTISSTLFTFYYQNHYSQIDKNFSIPKNVAGCTSLFFISLIASIKLKYSYGGIQIAPLWIYPVFLGFYEYYSDKQLVEKEVNRKSHMFAIINGFLLGIFLQLIQLKFQIKKKQQNK